ncbi:fumarylacetoacetate hydrolase family protein [Desulfobaculum bizertense]|uniref:2-keto-4-pentenoate hydratase/2-oxohepta-3-ene-1,7-dioic acid hydratase (Catechol pathway) n=1 Tax=Desulfobaculum bizertense DSM 18034 TaxID=1121442 RepID=A0A1T4VXE2_9BACT|nr:fumarylacetoacetate hydrolase family protein [Desulfobaculum bizertense]SKA69161.1 2-keto-4-pentenoate hydratase/2-oxohepta-3-ene-1,7-dioic acid hydratase (catechol pathway) [Desulfobaculum bizertense DSM 18034]
MKISRVMFSGRSFYAQHRDGAFVCLDRRLGLKEAIPEDQVTQLPLAVPSKLIHFGPPAPSATSPHISLLPPSAINSGHETVHIPDCATVSFVEPMLAVFFGRQCHCISPADMPPYIFGFSCSMSFSAQIQGLTENETLAAHAFDGFAPIGPHIETDIEAPEELVAALQKNEENAVSCSFSQLAYSPYEALSMISSIMTINPGDLIVLGDPKWKQRVLENDIITLHIPEIGTLENSVRCDKALAHATVTAVAPDLQ